MIGSIDRIPENILHVCDNSLSDIDSARNCASPVVSIVLASDQLCPASYQRRVLLNDDPSRSSVVIPACDADIEVTSWS